MIMELNISPTCPHVLGTIFTDEGQKVAFFRSSIDDTPLQVQEYAEKYELKDCYVKGPRSYAEFILEYNLMEKFTKNLNFFYI